MSIDAAMDEGEGDFAAAFKNVRKVLGRKSIERELAAKWGAVVEAVASASKQMASLFKGIKLERGMDRTPAVVARLLEAENKVLWTSICGVLGSAAREKLIKDNLVNEERSREVRGGRGRDHTRGGGGGSGDSRRREEDQARWRRDDDDRGRDGRRDDRGGGRDDRGGGREGGRDGRYGRDDFGRRDERRDELGRA